MNDDFLAVLAAAGVRATAPRKTVFTALLANEEPASISSLSKQCKTIDRVSVYRTMQLFVQLGIAEAIPHGWKQRYELAAPFKPHHHHITCIRCGVSHDIKNEQLEKLLGEIAKQQEFTQTRHTFEIMGICQKCHDQ